MVKLTSNQAGIGRVAIAPVILVILGTGGWYVWHAHKSAPSPVTQVAPPIVYSTRQDSEAKTGKPCSYSSCDYKCDVYYKGWLAE